MNEIGVIDIGVIEIGVNVKDGTVGAAPPDPNSVQLRSSQQPWTPLRITQWRPTSHDLPSLQHSPPTGAQLKVPQHSRPVSHAPPLLQQVWSVVTQVPSLQHLPLPLSGQHLWEASPNCQYRLVPGLVQAVSRETHCDTMRTQSHSCSVVCLKASS